MGQLQQSRGDDDTADPFVRGAVTFLLGTTAQVVDLLVAWFDHFDCFLPEPGRGLRTALQRRTARDAGVSASLATLMQRSPRHLVSLASLALDGNGREGAQLFLREELIRQAATDNPVLAKDIFTGRVVRVLEVAASELHGRHSG